MKTKVKFINEFLFKRNKLIKNLGFISIYSKLSKTTTIFLALNSGFSVN